MALNKEEQFNFSEYSLSNEDTFNGVDLSTLTISELINRNEWQMRIYGYRKMLVEVDAVSVLEFETVIVKIIMNDKNILAQNVGLQAISKFIDKNGQKISNLKKIWSEMISDVLIKKTLYNPKTYISSTNLAFSLFEQSIILVEGDFNKMDYFWEGMIEFVNNNRKSKGIAIKQTFGVIKLFLEFLNNYGIDFIPSLILCKTAASLLSECSDISLKDAIYDIISICSPKKNVIEYISSFVTSSQLKEIQKRISDTGKCVVPLKIEFINNITKNYSLDNKPDKSNNSSQNGDMFDVIEAVDVIKLLPANWLEILSNKEIKWSERKLIIDKFSNLCETHKKLAIYQFDNKNNQFSNKKNIPPSISDYQQILNILQRIIKCEGNTALILSVFKLSSNIVRCLRGKLTTVIRPLTTQISTKLKDQNKMVCNEAINFIVNVLKHCLTLEQIFDDLSINGFKEKVSTAKCSAISICICLIDDVISGNETLERHYKGFKLVVNSMPSLFDDASVQVRSSASTALVKLSNECFGLEINSSVNKILMGLNNAKLKLIKDIQKKMGLPDSTKEYFDKSNIDSNIINIQFTNETKASVTETNLEDQLKERKSTISMNKTINNNENILSQPTKFKIGDIKLSKDLILSNEKVNENNLNSLDIIDTPKLENFPRILHSVSLNDKSKISFYEKLSEKNHLIPELTEVISYNQKSVYIDKKNSDYFVLVVPNNEFILDKHKIDEKSLVTYVEPYISESLKRDMFGSDIILINYSIIFWEKYINNVLLNENKKFNFTYFLLSWILYNINKRHVLNYYSIIVVIINMVMKQEIDFIKKYSNNLVYFICFILVNIVTENLVNFESSSLLFQNELECYEKLIVLLIEKKAIYYDYASELVENLETIQYQVHSPIIINTILVSLLESSYCSEKSVDLINNQIFSKKDSFLLLENLGISNIYHILLFNRKSNNVRVDSSINKVISHMSNSLGPFLWNKLVSEFQKIKVENYLFKCDDIIEKHREVLYDLFIINILEYETIKDYNIIGSTGNCKEMGFFIKSELNFKLVNKIFVSFNLICNKADSILNKFEEIHSLSETDKNLGSLLVKHFYYFSQLLTHIFFSLCNKLYVHLENDFNLEINNFGTIFLKIVIHLDKMSGFFQKTLVNNDFPIKTMMLNTLFIMSSYCCWKDELDNETDKLKLVNSLNNIMGVNIISAYQNDLHKLTRTIVDVMIFGIKQDNKTIFDNDLLCRLLPKVLRRIKVSITNCELDIGRHIEAIIYCVESVTSMKSVIFTEKLNPIVDFSLDYLVILHESTSVFNVDYVSKLGLIDKIESISDKFFMEKICRVKSTVFGKSNSLL